MNIPNIKDIIMVILVIVMLALSGYGYIVLPVYLSEKKYQKKYNKGLIARLKWWICKENKYCKCCCVFCRYFIRCQIDVAREKE